MKTIAAVSLLGYAALVHQQVDEFTVSHPRPVLHAEPAYAGGTAIIKGEDGYYSRPPEAPIEVKVRKVIRGGAAQPDS